MPMMHIRITDEDAALLEALARQDGDVSGAALVRKLLREEAARRGLRPGRSDVPKPGRPKKSVSK
jgi:hypothetical protein